MSPKAEFHNEAEGKGETGPKSLARPCLWPEKMAICSPVSPVLQHGSLGQEMSHTQLWPVGSALEKGSSFVRGYETSVYRGLWAEVTQGPAGRQSNQGSWGVLSACSGERREGAGVTT